MSQRQALLEAQTRFCEDFCKALMGVVQAVKSKNQSDSTITELQGKVALACSNEPMQVLVRAGTRLWDYREDIGKGDLERLAHINYDETIKASTTDTGQVDYCQRILGKLRAALQSWNQQERQVVANYLKQMLKCYAGHVSGSKQLRELEEARKAREEYTGERLPP